MSSNPRAAARRAARGPRNPPNLTDGDNRAARRQQATIVRLSVKAQQKADTPAALEPDKPEQLAPVIDLSVRATARQQILQTANRHILGEHRRRILGNRRTGLVQLPARLLSARQINEAVCICRRNQLVSTDLLHQAGWRPRTAPATPDIGEAA